MGKLSRRQFATLVSSAAAGLVGGAAILSGCGKEAGPGDAKTGPADQHSCKGMNACKGQGGCKSGDNGCVGKNSCKGKGGCKVPVEHMK